MSDDIVQQIKDRLGVAELIGEYLKLEKAGVNYKGLCPFHNERTPSFMVNTEKNFWYCFGCQKGGDVFSFIMEIEGLTFREALERLAERTGLDIPKYHKADKQVKDRKKTVSEILEAATQYYENQLAQNVRGAEAKNYLAGRGITKNQISAFRIGYAPDGWRNITDFLLAKKFKIEDIVNSGLLVESERPVGGAERYYDRFRDRIMFPVIDIAGNVIGYSARVMPGGDEKQAKYINTPQTLLYDKSNVLYGLYQAKTEIKKNDYVLIVEGNLDVISSHVAGIGNVVAASGTALTEGHLKVLRRYTNNFKLCFDMDEAGRRATGKSIQTCLKNGLEVEIVLLPGSAKDVNDVIQDDPGKWQQTISGAIPVMKYFFQATFKNYNPSDVKAKKLIAKQLLTVINDIFDPIEQSYWLKKLSEAIQVSEEILTQVLEKAKVRKDTVSPASRAEKKNVNTLPKKVVLERRLLGLYNLFSNELAEEINQFDESLLSSDVLVIWQQLKAGKISQQYENHINQCALDVKYYYDKEEGFMESTVDPFREWKDLVGELKKERKKEMLKKLVWDIKSAEASGDEEATKLLLDEFTRLSGQE